MALQHLPIIASPNVYLFINKSSLFNLAIKRGHCMLRVSTGSHRHGDHLATGQRAYKLRNN